MKITALAYRSLSTILREQAARHLMGDTQVSPRGWETPLSARPLPVLRI